MCRWQRVQYRQTTPSSRRHPRRLGKGSGSGKLVASMSSVGGEPSSAKHERVCDTASCRRLSRSHADDDFGCDSAKSPRAELQPSIEGRACPGTGPAALMESRN